MEQKQKSNLVSRGIGIVTEDKIVGVDDIQFWLPEELSMVRGPIKDAKVDSTVTLPDAEGILKTSRTVKKVVMTAKWALGEANRMTAPDVVAGESVMIYQYGDDDDYYWHPLFSREPILRRLEHVAYAYSNLPDGKSKTSFNDESSYWLVISTLNKLIHFHTSDNDGEKTKYDLTIDTRNALLTLTDDLKNLIHIDTVGKLIRLINADSSLLELDKENIKLKCSKSFSADAGDGASMTAGSKATISAPKISLNCQNLDVSGGAMSMSGGSIETTAGTASYSTNNFDVDSDRIALNGRQISINGDDSVGELLGQMRGVFEQVQEHERRLAEHDSKIAALEQKVAEHTQTLAQHTQTLATHSSKLAEHDGKLATHESKISSLESTVSSHSDALTGLSSRVQNLENRPWGP